MQKKNIINHFQNTLIIRLYALRTHNLHLNDLCGYVYCGFASVCIIYNLLSSFSVCMCYNIR